MNFSKINELKPYDLNCNIFDVYSYDGLSMQELLCQFFTKINECIKTSDETIKLAEWLVNEGLKQEVAIKLSNWLNDGILENLINVTLFENLNKKIDNVSSQLEHNTNYLNGSENILNYKDFTHKNSNDDVIWDNALKEAMKKNKSIYFPAGSYNFTCKNIFLNEGNIIFGDGQFKTYLNFDITSNLPDKDNSSEYPPQAIDVNEGEFVFKYNNKSGFKDLSINIKNNYHGDVLLLEPGTIVTSRKYYVLDNVHIVFKHNSGYGNGLTIKLQNFDTNGVFNDGRANSLLYFYVNNLEVAYAHKGLNVQGKQQGIIQNPVWMTATSFTKCRFNSCVYGIYFKLENNGDKNFLDFHDIKFIDTELQIQKAGTFESTSQQGVGVYTDGGGHQWKLGIDFSHLTIWDSVNKINGIFKDSKIDIHGYFASNKKYGEGYKQGFKVENSEVSINEDRHRYRLTNKTTGNITEIGIIDGGVTIKDDPEGVNGYNARTVLTEKILPDDLNISNKSASYSTLENYDKNNSLNGYLDIGYGKSHKDEMNGRFNMFVKTTDGNLREVINYGNENIYYNDENSFQGFYAGNGMFIKEERKTVTVPAKTGYQSVKIPINTNYTFVPFLISCNLHYCEPYSDTYSYDVFIRSSQVIKESDGTKVIRVILKHNKESEITLRFSNILCGYLKYDNRIK